MVDEKYAAKTSFNWKKCVFVIGGIAMAAAIFYVFISSDSSGKHHEIHQAIHTKNATTGLFESKRIGDSTTSGTEKTSPPIASVTTTEEMKKNFLSARGKFNLKMGEDYGKYYQPIFYDGFLSRGRNLFVSGKDNSTVSWDRFKRKIIMKLLAVQQGSPKTPAFVWATGGHSATAGHGNFYDESYTAFLERAIKDVFAAVGINFVGRNYAMGGTSAAPEIALCIDEIFGQDIDVLVWDFGMTDGNAWHKQRLYHYQAGLNKGRPVNIVFHAGTRQFDVP